MKNPRSYVICASPRSGSTLLCYLLRRTGRAGVPESYFSDLDCYYQELQIPREVPEHPAGQARLSRAYLNAIHIEGSGDTSCFGLRLQGHTLQKARQGLAEIFPSAQNDKERLEEGLGVTRYLHLIRSDLVAQAVSRLKAEQSGLWHRNADGSELERLSDPQPLSYDPERLTEIIADLQQQQIAWQSWFQSEAIVPLKVIYEDLAADPQRVFALVLAHLDLDPGLAKDLEPPTAQLADDLSQDWIARYKADVGE